MMKVKGCLSMVLKGCVVLLLMAVSQDLSAQVAVKGKNLGAVEAIKQIEKSSDWTFIYNASEISALKAKDLDASGTIESVLKTIFSGTDVNWQINGKEILLKKGQAKTAAVTQEKGRRRVISGLVTDSNDGLPVIGAGVFVKGTQDGTVTDVDGAFTLTFVGKSCELLISYLGYKDQTVYITDQGIVDIQLVPDTEMLSEVIVIGAGSQKKVSVTGSVTAIKGDELRAPSSSLSSGFAGKLAGVVSMVTSGEPGSSSEFYIRGIGTFGGRATPLIILDGVEISTADLDNLPSESIESFSILKVASETAIYGARGANGVMIVTTKDGTMNSKAKVNVSLENSFLQPVNMVDYVDGATWMETYNEAMLTRTPGVTPKFDQSLIDLTRAGTSPYLAPDVDWQDLMFKKMNMNQRANINVQGGGSRVTYYLGLQANHDTGLLKIPQVHSFDNNINRWLYVFQNNISYKLTNSTKVDLRMNAQIGRHKGPGLNMQELFRYTYLANPINFPAYFPAQEGDTHVRYGSEWLTEGSTRLINPYAQMCKSFKETNSSTLNATLKVNQLLDFITEGLSVTALVNFKSYAYSYYTQTLDPYYYRALPSSTDDNLLLERVGNTGAEYISDSGITRYNDSTLYIDARMDYNRVFGGRHYVTGMLMYMQREYRNSIYPNRNQGLSGRFTYDYAHRYLVELNFGYNGTERLAKGSRFEFFPAMSLGWVVSEEKFWGGLKNAVDYFKIRGSYGLVGSDETGLSAGAAHFLYLDNVGLKTGTGFQTGYGSYGAFHQGPKVNAYAIAGATWEKVRKLDVGVDLSFFKARDLWKAGDLMYEDVDGDGAVNPGKGTVEDHGDLVVIGNATPRFSFGINLSAGYKGLEVTALLQGVGKRDFPMAGSTYLFGGRNYFKDHLDRFSPENPSGWLPRLTDGTGSGDLDWKVNTGYNTSRYLLNGAYMRLKNLMVSYSFGGKVLGKLRLRDLKVYVSCDNLLTLDALPGAFDPETMNIVSTWAGGSLSAAPGLTSALSQNGNGKVYPLSRTMVMGVEIKF